jgi:hypothetical protein
MGVNSLPVALSLPQEVTDPAEIAKICRFRAQVWRDIGQTTADAFPVQGWRDPIDEECRHWIIQFLGPPFYANILLGSLGTLNATPDNLCAVVRSLPPGTTWAATGIGRYQFFINSLAVTMGGHVRVGLEDALYYDWTAKRPATNARLIERIVLLARAAGREVATAEEARQIIGMPSSTTSLRRIA